MKYLIVILDGAANVIGFNFEQIFVQGPLADRRRIARASVPAEREVARVEVVVVVVCRGQHAEALGARGGLGIGESKEEMWSFLEASFEEAA